MSTLATSHGNCPKADSWAAPANAFLANRSSPCYYHAEIAHCGEYFWGFNFFLGHTL